MAQPPALQFSGIFVSYRRDDSSGHAGRLFDNLAKHFGEDQIFMDIDTIEPGEDFVEAVEKAVGSCEIVIVVMGQRWINSGDGTSRRLNDPNDFVRLEIASALKRNIRVIPVLVQKAMMPKPDDLPEDIAPLARRHAIELSDNRWQYDVAKLITVLERVLAARQEVRIAKAAKQAEGERPQQDNHQKRLVEESAQRRVAASAEEKIQEEQERTLHYHDERRVSQEKRQQELAEAEARRRAEEERQPQLAEDEAKWQSEDRARPAVEEVSSRRAGSEHALPAETRTRDMGEAERLRLNEGTQDSTKQERIRQELVETERLRAATQAPRIESRRNGPGALRNLSQKIMGKIGTARDVKLAWLTILATLLIFTAIAVTIAWLGTRSKFVNGTSLLGHPTLYQPSQPSNTAVNKVITNSVGMELVWISPAEFQMGREGHGDETPKHPVRISDGFYLGKYEVTQGQWRTVMGEQIELNGLKGVDGRRVPLFKGDNLPAINLSWNDAQRFISRLNEMRDGYIYRLPSEAQWEYACRAGRWENEENFGDDVQTGAHFDPLAWFDKNSGGVIHRVGQEKLPNDFGLYDMRGNVNEWCQDLWHGKYEGPFGKAPKDGSAWESGRDTRRVLRGGSWDGYAYNCRCANRIKYQPTALGPYSGFRVLAHAVND